MTGRLAGKVAVIVGAGAGEGFGEPAEVWGNGKAVAVQFAREGAWVAALDLKLEAAEATAAVIRAEGGQVLALACDATRLADLEAGMRAVVERWGRVDILHNNVGVALMGGPVDLAEADWRRSFDLNVGSAFLATKAVLPIMLRQRAGVIVNTSSIASLRWLGYPFCGYAASKAALNQFTVTVAMQHARDGIRCNAVIPGLMHTPMIYEQIKGQYADAATMVRERDDLCPMGRMGTAWDVARASAFLASDDAAYITGVCLPVDGGITLQI
jgi:NAD(P)-dependent dehydrogenase (short-subunit alcohol dehydrogenase family)